MSTRIEWTESTWNPVTGCDRTSPGCDHCYAMALAKRLKAMGQAKYQRDGDPRTSGPGFAVTAHLDALQIPLRWKTPRRVFVNSMSDLFHPDVSDRFIEAVFSVMTIASQHTYQILTKRPQRMASYFLGRDGHLERRGLTELPSHIWLGTSIENDRYTFRANHLRRIPVPVRFLSCEPLLGPLPSLDLSGISWVIVGGESGPGARPMDPAWVRDIRDRCQAAGVPFFFKQWGTWIAYEEDSAPLLVSQHGRVIDGHHLPGDLTWMDPCHNYSGTWWWPDIDGPVYQRVGKKTAGRFLDGRTWDEYPERRDCRVANDPVEQREVCL